MPRFASKHLESIGIGAVIGVIAFLIINVAVGRDIVPGPARAREQPAVAAPVQEAAVDPAALYATNCGACHQANGEGLPGTFPPLAGSSWVTGDPETLIRIMVAGVGGPIEVGGQTYNSAMPPQGHLNDEQMAAIATHVRSSFGNQAGAVEPDLVAQVRAEGRSQAWTSDELEAARSPE